MKNLIFDLDGTLGDSLPFCIAAFKESVEPFIDTKLTDNDIGKHFGISEDGIISALLPNNLEEGLAAFMASYSRYLDKYPDPFPGVQLLLKNLDKRGIFLTMVTGKSMKTAVITLKKYGIYHYFKDIYAGSPTGEVKDHCINELISKHRLNRADTVYIGDAISDIEASKNCNIRVIAAGWASTADIPALNAAKPDFLFTDFNDFSDYLHSHLDL